MDERARYDNGCAEANGQEVQTLRAERDRLPEELEAERSKGFWRRLFGGYNGIGTTQDAETARERMRGRLAIALVLTLIVVVVATFGYLLMLSRNFGELTTDDLIAVIPMVGTTLLTPLVGLIGAVTGFYYGGQTAVQAASQATNATTQGASQATSAASQGARTATQAATETAARLTDGTSDSSNNTGSSA